MRKNGRLSSRDAYAMAADFARKGDLEQSKHWIDAAAKMEKEEDLRRAEARIWELERDVERLERDAAIRR